MLEVGRSPSSTSEDGVQGQGGAEPPQRPLVPGTFAEPVNSRNEGSAGGPAAIDLCA